MKIGYSRPGIQAVVLFFAASLHTAFSGTITSIGTLGGDTASVGNAINSKGTVAGVSGSLTNPSEAFISSNGGVNFVPGIKGTAESFATGISSTGAVVGYSVLTNADGSPFHAFINSGGVTTNLFPMAGGIDSIANGINSSNQIAGASDTGNGSSHAVIFGNGGITDLGTLGGNSSDGLAINDLGTVAGWSQVAGGAQHATEFFAIGGLGVARIDLGVLAGFASSTATGINNAGEVVGSERLKGSNNSRAFVYGVSGMMNLGLLAGTNSNEATSVNSSGLVVGNSQTAGGDGDPFIWANGALIDLTSFLPANSGWQLESATAINDSGLVTGQGIFNGHFLGYLLDTGLRPTPEPEAFSLFGIGFIAIGWMRRKGSSSRG